MDWQPKQKAPDRRRRKLTYLLQNIAGFAAIAGGSGGDEYPGDDLLDSTGDELLDSLGRELTDNQGP